MIFSVRSAAREHPNGAALITASETWAWGELDRKVQSFAAGLLAEGPPQVAALVAHADVESVVRALACIELGVPLLPIHPRIPAAAREELIREANATLIDAVVPREETIGAQPLRSNLLAYVATSGSEGRPKLAMLGRDAWKAAVAASSDRLGWRDDDRWLLALPFAHVGGLSILLRCLAARRGVVLAEEGEDSLVALERGEATLASAVPTQLVQWLDGGPPPPRLRTVLVGGAASPVELIAGAREAGWPVRRTYGLTEACAQVATQGGDATPADPACGPPLPGTELRTDGGRLWLRSPSLLNGYLRDGEVVRAVDGEGWFRTGDLASLDERGHLHVHGRADDVIVTGGENVHPSQVERVLAQNPLFQQCCVFGIPDSKWGRLVSVAVVANAPESVLIQELRRVGAAGLAPHERPRRVAILGALPALPSGKLDRRAVQALCSDVLRPLD